MDTLIQLLSTALLLATGAAGVWGATELVKRAESIKWITEGNKPALRATAAAFSALAVVFLGLVSGTLTPESVQDVFVKILEAGLIWAGAHGTHKLLDK
ncbi:MAG: hypothetical protein ACOYUZ_00530 [Patescibacteria group bacterium]